MSGVITVINSVIKNPSCVQYSQAANTMSDVVECQQAKELGAINSTLR